MSRWWHACRIHLGRSDDDPEHEKGRDARPEDGDTFYIVAVSGTSAGALCALATWYGLVPNSAEADCGTIDKAVERLDSLWTSFAATTPVEIAHNSMASTLLQWKARGVPIPGSSPYDIYGTLGLAGLSMMGARRQYLEFPALLEALCPHFDSMTGREWRGRMCGFLSAQSKFSAATLSLRLQQNASTNGFVVGRGRT